jgi:hypothetical protein
MWWLRTGCYLRKLVERIPRVIEVPHRERLAIVVVGEGLTPNRRGRMRVRVVGAGVGTPPLGSLIAFCSSETDLTTTETPLKRTFGRFRPL